MSDVTIKQLAKVLDMPADKLLTQLGEAGMQFKGPDDVVSNDEKTRLLGYLREHRATAQAAATGEEPAAGRITLRRRKVSALKVSSGSGRRATSKTVNVEVRSKRTYVKRSSVADDESLLDEREEARRKLEESRAEQEREQAELAARQQRQKEAAATEAEAAAADVDQPEPMAEEPVLAEPEAEPEASVEQVVETDDEVTDSADEEPVAEAAAEAEKTAAPAEAEAQDESDADAGDAGAADDQAKAVEKPVEAKPASPKRSAWDRPVMPHIRERRKPRPKPAAKPAASTPGKPAAEAAAKPAAPAKHDRRHERDDDQAGRGGRRGRKLHLSERDRSRRGSDKHKAGSSRTAGTQHGFSRPTAPVVHEIAIGETNLVTDLAQKMAIKGAEVVKALFKMGVMATINQTIDHDTAALVVEELGHKPVEAEDRSAESELLERTALGTDDGKREPRPPVVTIMGHVDHGKTSLLDHIRRTKVAKGEAGGITQHIGAYHVETDRGVITFLDTPGHAAFSAMRARGAKSTDIVVLVVAADDGVKPQTIEAIEHAHAAKVPLVVAINKIDKSGANLDNVKQALASHDVVPEDWGGDIQCVPLSAKTGEGVDALLDAISLQAELMELKAVVDGDAAGTVIEARLERGRGPVATVLVQRGTLKKGDFVVCGIEYGRMRALMDARGQRVKSAGPSIPVQVLGLSGVPAAGDDFVVVADEKLAKQVAEERAERRRESRLVGKANRLEDIMARMSQADSQEVLNIVVKADVRGSAEALRESLSSIGNESVKVDVISSGVGGITESDATLAAASNALLIGFNVRADASARKVVDTHGIDMRYFSVIYDVIDQVTQAASGLLGTEVREDIIGVAEVRDVFRSSRFGAVAGCMVAEGTVKHNKPIRVLRDNTVIFEGELESLRRFKDNVDEVHAGTECGIAVKQYDDVKPGDQIECFERIEVARSL